MRSLSRVLILEDDGSLAQALSEFLTSQGFEVEIRSKAEEALTLLQEKEFQAILIDCLLPGTSGVDFGGEVRKKFPVEILDIVLMSGIFVDPAFVKDAVRSTKAIGFLKKPFELPELLNYIKPLNAPTPEIPQELTPRKALYQLLSKSKSTSREKRKAIEALDEIHGFDLPYILSLLSESKATGHLNIVKDSDEVSGVSLSQGKIVAVDIADTETQLGTLLLQAGDVIPEDLNELLKSSSKKKLGERLIEANALSPHLFKQALNYQMSLRLSRTIVDDNVKINFVATEVDLTHPHIDSEMLGTFLHDWVASKISDSWLRDHFMQWGSIDLLPGPHFAADHSLFTSPIVSSSPHLVEKLKAGCTLNDILLAPEFQTSETALKALHLLMIRGIIMFGGSGEKAMSESDRLRLLTKINAQFKGKNRFQIFEQLLTITGLSSSDGMKVISSFLDWLGSPPAGTELKAKYDSIIKQIEPLVTLLKSGSIEASRAEHEKAEAQRRLKYSTQYEEGRNLLHKFQYSKAFQTLEILRAEGAQFEGMLVYLAWARLGMLESKANKAESLKEIERDLIQVPPEERVDASYNFVFGLFLKAKGDTVGAKKSFEKALALDSNFMPAKRELNIIQTQNAPKQDLLNRDLKDIIGGFFKKKN